MQAIIVTLDRLATTALGCYGNEWIETPHLDRLASEAVVFDSHFAEHAGAASGTSLGTGRFPHAASSPLNETESTWSSMTAAAGVELHLFHEAGSLPWSMTLSTTTRTLFAAQADPDPKPDEIPFARLVQAALPKLVEPRGTASRIVWLHSAGIPEPWLPPEGFATLYFEDFEERGCDMTTVALGNWGTHPAVYAGYVSLLDHWLGELFVAVKTSALNEPTLLVFVAARGCDWTQEPGPRREFIPRDDDAEEESPTVAESPPIEADAADIASVTETTAVRVHQPAVPRPTHSLTESVTRTPLILRLFDEGAFDSEFAGTRSNRLVQTADLAATLLHFFQLPMSPVVTDGRSLLNELTETEPRRESICFTDGNGSRGIRTAEWSCLVQVAASSDTTEFSDHEPVVQLFAKPEDYWEVNDVSGQQREVTAALIERLNAANP